MGPNKNYQLFRPFAHTLLAHPSIELLGRTSFEWLSGRLFGILLSKPKSWPVALQDPSSRRRPQTSQELTDKTRRPFEKTATVWPVLVLNAYPWHWSVLLGDPKVRHKEELLGQETREPNAVHWKNGQTSVQGKQSAIIKERAKQIRPNQRFCSCVV